MDDASLIALEPAVRGGIFAAALALLLVVEAVWPRRHTPRQRPRRWAYNVSVAAAGSVLVRLALPIGAFGAAYWARAQHFGIFNIVEVSGVVAGAISFLALDALIYAQHRVFHAVPVLWQLHRLHHRDVELDATTGVRFHPVEILLSMLLKIGAVLALGAPPLAVLVFEVLLNACAMFNHANLGLSPELDARLRALLVTPDMHRVHHSVHRAERDSNFGFSLSAWDRLFGTYVAQPADGHETMQLGVSERR